MTAAAALNHPVWSLQSTLWLSDSTVELYLYDTRGCEDALVTVCVTVDWPRTASEPAYREELRVLDVEGAPLDALGEVEANREQILREFYSAKSLGRC